MKEPKEVKPSKPKPQLSKEVLDLDKLASPELKVVADARKAAASQVANFKLNPGLAEAIKSMSSLGEQVQKMFADLPSFALPSIERPEMKMAYTIPPNPQYETNRLLREVSAKLDNLSEQNAKLVAPNFDADNCEIIFANKRIEIPKNTNQAELVKSLFSEKDNLAREWDWSEMLEDWGYQTYGKEDWRKVYMAAREVNKKVAIETGVKDLLSVTKLTVGINSNYLGQIS